LNNEIFFKYIVVFAGIEEFAVVVKAFKRGCKLLKNIQITGVLSAFKVNFLRTEQEADLQK